MRIVLPVLFATVTVTAAAVVVLPAASRATAVNVCDALLAVVVSHAIAYGAGVSSTPRLAPSSRNWTPTTPTLVVAVARVGVVPETVAPPAGAVRLTVGGVVSLNTVTVTVAAVAVLPAASRATAVSVCDALLAAVVSHASAYGAVVSSTPTFAPSRRNWTPTTPTLSDALALIVVVPETVAPFAGAVRLTVGGVVSLSPVTVIVAAVAVLPAASRATAVSVCDALLAVVVSHAIAYGANMSSTPTSAPSRRDWTPTTPTLSDALALIVVVPETVAPAAGAVRLTVGGVVSGGGPCGTATPVRAKFPRPVPHSTRALAVFGSLYATTPLPVVPMTTSRFESESMFAIVGAASPPFHEKPFLGAGRSIL